MSIWRTIPRWEQSKVEANGGKIPIVDHEIYLVYNLLAPRRLQEATR